jgi:hypothetical protein
MRIADVLAVGAPIAVGLAIAMIPIRLLVEGDTDVTGGSVRDLIVRFVRARCRFLTSRESLSLRR